MILQSEDANRVRTLTLNRPEVLNAFNEALYQATAEALAAAAEDAGVAVVRSLTPDAPELAGIVEELFPAEAITDLKAFFGAADDADLQQRLSRMVASTSAFGANENIDTVPTSRYVLKTPFQT